MALSRRDNIKSEVKSMVERMRIIKDDEDRYDAYMKCLRDDEHQARMENLAYETHEQCEKELSKIKDKMDNKCKDYKDKLTDLLTDTLTDMLTDMLTDRLA